MKATRLSPLVDSAMEPRSHDLHSSWLISLPEADSSSPVCFALVRVTGKAIQPPYAALESLVCLVSGAKVFILLVWQLF